MLSRSEGFHSYGSIPDEVLVPDFRSFLKSSVQLLNKMRSKEKEDD